MEKCSADVSEDLEEEAAEAVVLGLKLVEVKDFDDVIDLKSVRGLAKVWCFLLFFFPFSFFLSFFFFSFLSFLSVSFFFSSREFTPNSGRKCPLGEIVGHFCKGNSGRF